MKSRYNPLSKKRQAMADSYLKRQAEEYQERAERRIRENARQYIDTYRNYIVYRFMGIACITLNERHRFARQRLCELIALWGEEFKQLEAWKDDSDDLLILNLRRLHMDELADALQAEIEKLKAESKGE